MCLFVIKELGVAIYINISVMLVPRISVGIIVGISNHLYENNKFYRLSLQHANNLTAQTLSFSFKHFIHEKVPIHFQSP